MSAVLASPRLIDRLLGAALSLPSWDGAGPLVWAAQPDSLPAVLAPDLRPAPSYRPDLSVRGPLRPENLSPVGAMLLAENRSSIEYRYSWAPPRSPYEYCADPATRTAEPVNLAELTVPAITGPDQLAYAVEWFQYQSCEHPDWFTSQARSFTQAVEERCGAEPVA